MDPRLNPYAPGAGVKPPELAGRQAVVESASIAFARTRNGLHARDFMLLGLRGVGKTVLLNTLHDEAKAQGFHTLRFEAPEGGQLAANLVPELRVVLRRISLRKKAGHALETAGTALRNFASAFRVKYEGFDFGMTPDAIADSGDIERDVPELLLAAAQAAKDEGSALGLFIDEVQYLGTEELAALVRTCHEAAQQGLPFILVGAGLPQIAALAGDAKSYSERLFDYPLISALDRDAAFRAIAEPAERAGAAFSDEALEAIHDVTGGYPYFLQIWGKFAWDNAETSPIPASVVHDSHPEIIAHLDATFFRSRFDRLTEREQVYMRGMAELGPGPHRSGEIAAVLGASSTQLGPVRKHLIEIGMIYSQRHGETAFTVPLFDAFMKRAMPELVPYRPRGR
ncbi:AAA family ATPase [Rhodovulum sp. DZ06]|uniref:AAA family ATPase n=1 Tax=Rhodovulum sp. DZ06 TaxID=3425126 RepID=UPI003D3250C8